MCLLIKWERPREALGWGPGLLVTLKVSGFLSCEKRKGPVTCSNPRLEWIQNYLKRFVTQSVVLIPTASSMGSSSEMLQVFTQNLHADLPGEMVYKSHSKAMRL